jgi:uncharacterized protein
MDLPQLIERLSDPAAYPHQVASVEVRQTHISAVFLADRFVYKIKKPVAPGFLDYTTVEKRRYFCEEEVRLNRRLAPDVYLGVVPIVRVGADLRVDEAEGEVVEWAVKMARLPDDATFQARLLHGAVTNESVAELARRVAVFHNTAERSDRIGTYGRFEVVARSVRDVVAKAAVPIWTAITQADADQLAALTEVALARHHTLIDRRSAQGMTCDCHGDLRLDHVYHFPDRAPPADLVVIDCIEFNAQFRFIDPVADAAFLVMDLKFHGRPDLAQVFADVYLTAARDEGGRALMPLYTAYRAAVRASVEGLLATEPEVPELDRSSTRTNARAHWMLALAEFASSLREIV